MLAEQTIDQVIPSTLLRLPSGRVLEVECHGEGAPVLLIPGLGCSTALFSLLLKELPLNRRYIVVNPRGIGQSSKAMVGDEVEDYAIDFLLAMVQLGYQSFDVVGVSFGGFIAQVLADLVPHRVESLALVSTSSSGEEFCALPELRDEDLMSFYALDPIRRAELSVAATTYPALKSEDPDRYQGILSARTEWGVSGEQVLVQNGAAKRFLARTRFCETLRCPTLVMSGACDRFVPVENARTLAELIDGAKLSIVDRSDHLFILERPDVCARLLESFWESL